MANDHMGGCERKRKRESERVSETRMRKKKGVFHILAFWFNITDGNTYYRHIFC